MGRDRQNQEAGKEPARLPESRKEPARVGFLGLPEAPVFYPTQEEFEDPLVYIDKIRQEAEAYGICRIVPPKTWNPPFAIDSQSFSFPTKLQAIHHLQMRPAACDAETFKLEYTRFLKKEGHKIESWPIFCGKELDLCTLFSAVKRHGGYQKVVKDNKWGDVLQILDPSCIPAVQSNSLQSSLCQMYETYLYAYQLYQSNFAFGKRFRTSKVQDERCKSRGKRTGRQGPGEESAAAGALKMDEVVVHKTYSCPGIQNLEETCAMEIDSRADQICEQCHSGAHEQHMLLCDRCDRGWHLYCLTPPLSAVPSGNWYCFDCLASENESFGFTPGLVHNLDSFRRVADRFKKKWFGAKEASCSEIEEEFWSVVERAKGPVEVFYGSDLATEVYGSGFPRSSDPVPQWGDKTLWKEYAASPWNLNNFAKLKGSLLQHVEENIPGVIVPWVYIGMLFSSFCWHYEDQCFYSINYLHWGEPKCWYSVPGSAVNAFEQVMHKTFPDLFEAQPDLLFQLVTMLNPKVLRDNDVPVCTTIQECGNFVITFPRSYHGGFNHGFNCAEAVNFATADWLPFSRFGVERYRLFHKAAVLSHEELLCVVAKDARSPGMSPWVKKELNHVITMERRQREWLWKSGLVQSSRMTPRKSPGIIGTEEDPECIICRYYLYLSALTCSCCPGKAVCLQHAEQLCECSMEQKQLLYRYPLAELEDLLSEIPDPVDNNASTSSIGVKGKQRRRCRQPDSTVVAKKVKGSLMSHTKLAEIWLMNAQSVLCSTPKLSTVEDLLAEAEQFLWAGHEMDPVRLVERDLRSAQSWAQGVAACAIASETGLEGHECNLEKVPLATAHQLLAVNPPPCDMKDSIPKLKAALENAMKLQQQITTLFSSSPPWELTVLESLQQEVLQSPLEFPEADKLKDVIVSAQVWGEQVRNVFSQPRLCWDSGQRNVTDINKLHLLQFEADKLSVLLPEKKVLDAVIKKLEGWQEHAKELLDTTAPLQVVEEFLSEIRNVPVYVPEAESLERRRFEAREWTKCACKVLADVQQQTYYNASIELLSALLRTGESLEIAVTEIDLVKAELKKVSWLERAAKGLQSPSSSKVLKDILDEADRLSLQNEKIYSEIHHVVEAAQLWESKAAQFLERGASLDDYRNLKSESGKIYASLSGWVAINIGIMQAESWLHRAQPFFSQKLGISQNTSILDLATLQDLVIESQNLKVTLHEVHLLRTVHEDIRSWRQRAAVLRVSAKQVLGIQRKDQPYTDSATDGMRETSVFENDKLLSSLRKMVDEGMALGFELPEIAELRVLITATEWNLKALRLLLNSPTMQELEALIQEASNFSEYVGQLTILRDTLDNARAWVQKVNTVLPRRDFDFKCTVRQLEELLTEAQALHVSMSPDVAYMEELLTSHKAWQKQVSQYLYAPDRPISWTELHLLQGTGKTSLVKSEEAEVLEMELVNVENWISQCYKALLGPLGYSSISLLEILSKVQKSLDSALQKVQSSTSMETEKCCHICREDLGSASSSVLKCDNCMGRYHSSCIGCVQTQTRAQKQFICPFCTALTTGILCLDDEVLSKICVTKRPTTSALLEVLEAAQGIRFRMEEIELLQSIVRSVQAWQAYLHKIVEPILVQGANQTDVDTASLLAALKIAGTMEVQEDENSKLRLALSVNAWRMHAKTLLESPSKPFYRSVCRILKEGLAIPLLSDDCFLNDLKKLELLASDWANQAKKAVEDNGFMPLEDVSKLIVEGERLPVAFGKELAALRARTVLYCTCRKPYDEDRAMIACDCCSEWYHFDCVNLPEPDSSDDECELLLQRYGSAGEFYCPNCKNPESKDTSRLISELVQESGEASKDGSVMHAPVYTPPFWYARGKRSSRATAKVRADLQQRWHSLNSVSNCSKDVTKDADCSQTCLSASGRPCRRTAGQHSRFESFVLLMHSG